MNIKDHRKICITFRISEQTKAWLDSLVRASDFSSSSDYLNTQIRLRMRSHIFDKAMNEGKLIAGKELKFTEKLTLAIDGPEDVKLLPNCEKALKCWFDELKETVKRNANDTGMPDIAEYLSTDKGIELLDFFFNNYTKIKELSSLTDEMDVSMCKLKKGRKP